MIRKNKTFTKRKVHPTKHKVRLKKTKPYQRPKACRVGLAFRWRYSFDQKRCLRKYVRYYISSMKAMQEATCEALPFIMAPIIEAEMQKINTMIADEIVRTMCVPAYYLTSGGC